MSILLAILIALMISYAAITIALVVLKPDDRGIAAAMRVLPDTIASSPDWPATEGCRCPPAPRSGRWPGTSPPRARGNGSRAPSAGDEFAPPERSKGQERRSVPHGHITEEALVHDAPLAGQLALRAAS